jgi:DMSO/TMAO reductase YedYZ molybdopterin-dependent catalytic subunit
MTRRKFVRLSASALALAHVPFSLRLASAAVDLPPKFGGPTPNSKFYSYGSAPPVDANSWRLKIKGLVANPLELSYADIRKLPPIRETLTLECISNPPDGNAISNADWVGTRLKAILDCARVRPEAKYVRMRGSDGYLTGVPRDEIMREENFLPYVMNGVPLPPKHGFPVRIFIPGKYGLKQPKWITEIEFLDASFRGYWEQRGWSDSAWRRVNSGFFSPRPGEGIWSLLGRSRPREGILSLLGGSVDIHGPTDFYGWALAGPSGIKRVEVSVDNGATWRDAQLIDNRSPYVWTVWKYHFDPKRPSSCVMRVRASDGNGVAQPIEDRQRGEGISAQARMTLNVSL